LIKSTSFQVMSSVNVAICLFFYFSFEARTDLSSSEVANFSFISLSSSRN